MARYQVEIYYEQKNGSNAHTSSIVNASSESEAESIASRRINGIIKTIKVRELK
nr:hypothetical protein [Fusobacterium gastrosuis]